ncbi:allantoicase [Streptomyces sp. NPDC049881]|uniref:allantoicase n=1 Tax=Streptomyces sp. NPDC049881 TaxID=3155778 RepID=UPI00342AA445
MSSDAHPHTAPGGIGGFTGQADPYRGGDPYADYRAPDPADLPFTALPDLADRRLGGSVVAASDEFFAERENLLLPHPARFDPLAFGHKGKVMDGWETRRRRGTGPGTPLPASDDHDWALIRLGVPGVVRGLVVDTAHFRGNHPAAVRVEASADPDDPSGWTELLPRTPVGGHAANAFAVTAAPRRVTHLRLSQFPDGGVARLRAYGEAVPEPAWLAALGTFDLAALEHGGLAEDASDRFYSPPVHTTHPGRARAMDEGWETRRRREPGNDWLAYRLAAQGVVRAVEIDTGTYKGNAPGWASLSVRDAEGPEPDVWHEILPPTALLPDCLHRLTLPAPAPPATHARLDVLPDGGIARLRLHGTPTAAGMARLTERHAALSTWG